MAFISFSDRRSAIPDAVISVLENPLPDFVDGKEVRLEKFLEGVE